MSNMLPLIKIREWFYITSESGVVLNSSPNMFT